MHAALKDTGSLGDEAAKHSQAPAPTSQAPCLARAMHCTVGGEAAKNPVRQDQCGNVPGLHLQTPPSACGAAML